MFKNILLVIGSITCVLALLEAVFAVIGWPQIPVSYFQTCQLRAYQKGEFMGYYPNQACYQCYYRHEPAHYYDKIIEMGGKRFECIRYSIGPEGYRTPSFKVKQGPRIVTIGDSFTFGEGVKEKDTYPRLLEQRTGIETINLSMQGLNTHYERIILQANMNLRPDLIIVGYVLNDTMPHQETIKLLGNTLERATQVPGLLRFSRVGSFVFMRVSSFLQSRKTVDSYFRWFIKGWPQGSQELLAIKQMCQQNGADLLVVLFPILYQVDDAYPFRDLHEQIGRFARENEIGFIDLLDVYQNEDASVLRVHPLDHHPNAKAHRMAFQAIYQWLEEQNKFALSNFR